MPENEAERLNTLRGYGILDTRPEDRFDDLTRLAAIICGTPSSVISLVDEDRQWFKSKIGFTVCQTPREDAICAHAIMTPDVFVVEYASQDARFAANPMVLGSSTSGFTRPLRWPRPTGIAWALCVCSTACHANSAPINRNPCAFSADRL